MMEVMEFELPGLGHGGMIDAEWQKSATKQDMSYVDGGGS